MIELEETIEAELDKAVTQIHLGRSKFPGMSYEEGVRAALEWVLGHCDESPMED